MAYKITNSGRSAVWYRIWFGTRGSQVQILPPRPLIIMKKAKIYKPAKTAMQSGKRNTKNWILEFDTLNTGINPLMGWETSQDTMSEIKLEFSNKKQAINFAKKNNIDYYVVEPQKNKIIKKSYAENFLKNK